jgi:crotonobetainyl-CoA:carnitine CoA-transferase CaiB-like acyl-CoA transferase
VLPAAVPRLSETPAELRHAGPALGADTAEVLGRLLGLDADALRELAKTGVI